MNILSLTKPLLLATLLQMGSTFACGESVDEFMSKGDVYDKRLQAASALKCYLPAEKVDPKNEQLLLRIARQYRHLMADATGQEEKLRLGNIALDYAQRAVALAPNDSESHLSVAITYGKMLPIFGTRQQVETSPKIKSEVDEAIRLNPRNDLAWHILGRWHRILADVSGLKRTLAPILYGRLPKGSNEEAAKCLEKAVELNPSRLMHYIELGRVYAQQGRNAEARRMIEKGLSMPCTEKDDPDAKAHGREVLEKLRS